METFRKNKSFLLFATSLILISLHSICAAEKIYYKDGRTVEGQISYSNKGAVWIKRPDGAFGIDLTDIDRIDNDDGTVSRFDHKRISNSIETCVNEKKYDDAVKWCDFLLKSYPDSVDVRFLRATLNQKIGNTEAAKEDYEYLVKGRAPDALAYNNLAVIYASEKRYDEARDYFEKALKKDPGLEEAKNNLKALENRRIDNK